MTPRPPRVRPRVRMQNSRQSRVQFSHGLSEFLEPQALKNGYQGGGFEIIQGWSDRSYQEFGRGDVQQRVLNEETGEEEAPDADEFATTSEPTGVAAAALGRVGTSGPGMITVFIRF